MWAWVCVLLLSFSLYENIMQSYLLENKFVHVHTFCLHDNNLVFLMKYEKK